MKSPAILLLLALPLTARAIPGQPLEPWLSQSQSFQTAAVRPHPRLLLTPDEITRVRAAVKDPRMAAYWQAVRRYVDEEKNKPVTPEPPAYKAEWTIEEWRAIVNAGGDAQNHILAASFAWVVTQDPGDLAEAKRRALAAAAWDPHGPTGIETGGVDHAAHDTLHALSLAYDWLYDQWTPAEKATLRTCIAERTRALYKHLNPYRYDSWNNHAWFQTTAMVDGGLALAGEVPEAETWWKYGAKLYFTEYLPLGGKDGDWHEGTHYISYTLIFVYQFADVLKSATGIDAYQVPWVKNVTWFRLYTNPPKSGGIKFNDNNYTPPDSWDRMTAYNAARTTQEPALEWYAEQMDSTPPNNPMPALYTLIYRDLGLKPAAPSKSLPEAVWYRDSGWVVLRTDLSRSDDLEFGLKAGPHLAEKGGKGHDHPDQNGFLINNGAEPLAIDSGYYDYYGSPHHTNWTFTPQAHNTFLVDGQGQLIAPEVPARVTAFVSQRGGYTFVEGEAAQAYPAGLLKSWRRQVLFLEPDTFLIRDVLKPAKPATLQMLLHGPSRFAVDGQGLFTAAAKNGVSSVIAAPSNLKIDQWGGFPDPPERKKPTDRPDEWHLTATTPGKVGDTVFVTALRATPATGGRRAAVKRTVAADRETISVDGGTPCTYFTTPGAHKVGEYTTDARVAAIGKGRVLLIGATWLKRGNTRLFSSRAPADVSWVDGAGSRTLTVRLDAPGKVSVAQPARPASVRGAASAWDARSRTLALTLPANSTNVTIVR